MTKTIIGVDFQGENILFLSGETPLLFDF